MRTQQDHIVRVVALDNLIAMIDAQPDFKLERVSRSRVTIRHAPTGIFCVLPCYPSIWPQDVENPRVILDPLRFLGDPDDDGAHVFDILFDQYAVRTSTEGEEEHWHVAPISTMAIATSWMELQHAVYNATGGPQRA